MSSPATRQLIVIRHAKAEPVAATDLDRPLARRGREDAVAIGSLLAARGVLPDLALVSAAVRTQETWQGICRGLGAQPAVWIDRSLYAAGLDGVLELLRAVPAATATVALVGHNPTMAELALLLDDGTADPAVSAALRRGFPTSTVARFEISSAWAALDLGTAQLTEAVTARA